MTVFACRCSLQTNAPMTECDGPNHPCRQHTFCNTCLGEQLRRYRFGSLGDGHATGCVMGVQLQTNDEQLWRGANFLMQDGAIWKCSAHARPATGCTKRSQQNHICRSSKASPDEPLRVERQEMLAQSQCCSLLTLPRLLAHVLPLASKRQLCADFTSSPQMPT
eukprot:SAG31_NODE_6922_length_1849_cov_1.511429_1_plen_163_part_10